MNCAGASIFEIGKEKEMSEFLINLWQNLTTHSIFQEWPGGILDGLLHESGLFDDTPLLNLLTEICTKAGSVKKHLIVSADDSETGDYVPFDSDDFTIDEIPLRVISSASIPLVFPHRVINDWVLMDGGTVWNTNLVSAVNKCVEIGYSKDQIVMDIAITHAAKIDTLTESSNTIGNFLRYREIKKYYKGLRDILEFEKAEPEVDYRYLFIPSQPLPGGIHELNFTYGAVEPMIELGMKDAQDLINMGEQGKGMHVLKEYYRNGERKTFAPVM